MDKTKKCHMCSGRATLTTGDILINNGTAIAKNIHHYICQKCGEEFYTSKQMDALDKKIKEKTKIPVKA